MPIRMSHHTASLALVGGPEEDSNTAQFESSCRQPAQQSSVRHLLRLQRHLAHLGNHMKFQAFYKHHPARSPHGERCPGISL